MQGRCKFNRCRYNLPTLQTDIALRDMQLVSVEAASDIGGDIPFKGESGGSLHGTAEIGSGNMVSERCAEIFSPAIYLTRIYSLYTRHRAMIGAKVDGTLDCIAGGMWEVTLNTHPALKGDIRISDDCTVRVFASGLAGANYKNSKMEGYEIMNSAISTAHYNTEYIEISLSIPAGSTLEIDSEYFTVTLDGENALYAQSGAWLMLDRDVESIEVIFPSRANASAALEYKERYL